MKMTMKKTIALIFGGDSLEHEISIISTSRVLKALDFDKYNVLLVYLDKENNIYFTNNVKVMDLFINPLKAMTKMKKGFICKEDKQPIIKSGFKVCRFDIALPIIHGRGIEDGTLYGLLNFLHIPYIGGTILEGSLGMDKSLSKQIASIAGADIVKGIEFNLEEDAIEDIAIKSKKLDYPLMVKANTLGSSIGIKKVNNDDELIDALTYISKYDKHIIIEKFLNSFCEYNIALFNNNGVLQLSAIEKIEKDSNYLSFDDKYDSDFAKKIVKEIPAKINEELEKKIKKVASKIYKKFKAEGLVRIDFLFDKNENILYFSEINIVPGSLAYYLFEKQGISFMDLLDILISNAKISYLNKKKYINSLSYSSTNSLLNMSIKK